MNPPVFFDVIRDSASQRWDQLEKDPDLAGPWHQLFKQVQSPRNVLSELLQNADDAGATEVKVRLENRMFFFEHNGQDFTEEHFKSLCRFGYSNKRSLHTIGFRGVGFKSTFSLGDRVDLFTPSLSVCFHRNRFTEPHWLHEYSETHGRTRIRVTISDRHRQQEVEKSLQAWLESPVSLLFFRNIRSMQIDDCVVHWDRQGPGPIPQSEWVVHHEKDNEAYLLIRSEAAPFPDEALIEIRNERMLATEEESEFPLCSIEIVMGIEGRLYVVLPTGVLTDLPFACNAPFIQDPARLKIKDPETSPTNRWLLKRAGELAANAFLQWLGQSEAPVSERARAYALFPDLDRENNSIEGVSGSITEEAFEEVIKGQAILLTEKGQLVLKNQSVIIPRPILDIWEPDQAAVLLDEDARPALNQHISTADCRKLTHWNLVDEICKQDFIDTLRWKQIPRPKTWRQLLNLWIYIAPEYTGYRYTNTYNQYRPSINDIRIVPVQGKDELYDARGVVRLGEEKLLRSKEDWEFLASHLIVMNQNWPRFLARQRRTYDEREDSTMQQGVEDAYAVLAEIELDKTSDVNTVFKTVSTGFFAQSGVCIQQCIQLAQIGAKLGANVGDAFCFFTRDNELKTTKIGILFDRDSQVEVLLPEQQRKTLLLHPDYTTGFSSCSQDEWNKWVNTGHAGLRTFVPLIPQRISFYGRPRIEQDATKRGLKSDLNYRYVTDNFFVEDWDIDQTYWNHWKKLAAKDEFTWVKVINQVFAEGEVYWNHAKTVKIYQIATTRRAARISDDPLVPTWILSMRELPCLLDDKGFPRKPGDLLRRTPETEPLLNVEHFVHGSVDLEATRSLLDLLGVQSKPTSPDRLLDRLRALAKADNPPTHEVEKWYGRLDKMMYTCSTGEFQEIITTFQSEKLILTQDDDWASIAGVYLSSDEDTVPSAAVIRSGVRDLSIWRKIGIAERPTAEQAIKWLKGLPSGEVLSQEDGRRVRELLKRHPTRIWEECEHWLNLEGEWIPVDRLTYGLTMQFLVPWGHLFSWVKQQTADLVRLQSEVTSSAPFTRLTPLAAQIEERFQESRISISDPVDKEWINTFGAELCNVVLETEEETERVRTLAASLEQTRWCETTLLEVTPYIDGKPAGTGRRAEVVWFGQTLYVESLSHGKLARCVPAEIGRVFGRRDIQAALDYSYDRSVQNVREYLNENFNQSVATGRAKQTGENKDGKSGYLKTSESAILGESVDETLDESMNGDLPGSGVGQEETGQNLGGNPTTANMIKTTKPHSRVPKKPPKPAIIERFAKAHHFEKKREQRFVHENGSWIGRTNGMSIPWEHRTADGNLVRYYLPKDHCLEREPLQLEADIWNLIEQNPNTYALILTDIKDNPIEVTGVQILTMRDQRKVTLYPATYRLVYGHDHHV